MGRIEYTHKSWNPISGCLFGLPCWDRCWARSMAKRLNGMGVDGYEGDYEEEWFGPRFHERRLGEVLDRLKPTRYAVGFMGDIALSGTHAINLIFEVMHACKQHRFLLLTKRPKMFADRVGTTGWAPMPHVWIGTSAGTQSEADERVPQLLAGFVGWHKWLSLEPMIGPVDLGRAGALPVYKEADTVTYRCGATQRVIGERPGKGWQKHDGNMTEWLDWVVLGGESGPQARPMHMDWVRSVRDQCEAAGVPFWFKQWGEWACVPDDHPDVTFVNIDGSIGHNGPPCPACMAKVGKKHAGNQLDGEVIEQIPTDLLVDGEGE